MQTYLFVTWFSFFSLTVLAQQYATDPNLNPAKNGASFSAKPCGGDCDKALVAISKGTLLTAMQLDLILQPYRPILKILTREDLQAILNDPENIRRLKRQQKLDVDMELINGNDKSQEIGTTRDIIKDKLKNATKGVKIRKLPDGVVIEAYKKF